MITKNASWPTRLLDGLGALGAWPVGPDPGLNRRRTVPLLSLIGHTTAPAGTRFVSPAEVVQFAAAQGVPVPAEIKSAC